MFLERYSAEFDLAKIAALSFAALEIWPNALLARSFRHLGPCAVAYFGQKPSTLNSPPDSMRTVVAPSNAV